MEFEIQKRANENSGVIDNLQFKLGHVANYVVSRSSVIYHPVGGSVYAPRASKTLRFNLAATANGWLDCGTINLRFKFNNVGTGPIGFLNALPANMFYRMRIIAHNQIVEDWSYYNRVYNLIHCTLPAEKKMNDYSMGFGPNDDFQDPTDAASVIYNRINFESANLPPNLDANASKVMQLNLLSGLLSQNKFLPLHYLKGLIIELELVGSVLDCVTYADPNNVDWTITEPNIMCDVIQIDQSLENEFSNAILDGESLPIAYDSFVTQLQSMPQGAAQMQALSRAALADDGGQALDKLLAFV